MQPRNWAEALSVQHQERNGSGEAAHARLPSKWYTNARIGSLLVV
jgi:hypothetical protein